MIFNRFLYFDIRVPLVLSDFWLSAISIIFSTFSSTLSHIRIFRFPILYSRPTILFNSNSFSNSSSGINFMYLKTSSSSTPWSFIKAPNSSNVSFVISLDLHLTSFFLSFSFNHASNSSNSSFVAAIAASVKNNSFSMANAIFSALTIFSMSCFLYALSIVNTSFGG